MADTGVILGRLDELATTIGRLRRRLNGDKEVWTDLDVWTLEQIGRHVEALHLMLSPTAADLAAYHAGGYDTAADAAIAVVDARCHALRVKLGLEAA